MRATKAPRAGFLSFIIKEFETMKLTKEMLRQMVAEEMEKLLRPEEEEEEPEPLVETEGEDPKAVAQFCSKRGYYALNRLLTIQNNLARAAKGDLGKK